MLEDIKQVSSHNSEIEGAALLIRRTTIRFIPPLDLPLTSQLSWANLPDDFVIQLLYGLIILQQVLQQFAVAGKPPANRTRWWDGRG